MFLMMFFGGGFGGAGKSENRGLDVFLGAGEVEGAETGGGGGRGALGGLLGSHGVPAGVRYVLRALEERLVLAVSGFEAGTGGGGDAGKAGTGGEGAEGSSARLEEPFDRRRSSSVVA